MPRKTSTTGRAVVPARNTNLAQLPERIAIGDHEVRPEQLYVIPDRRPNGQGPWSHEPFDKIAWHDAASGLDCILLRQETGVWGGFVAVLPGHPLHGYLEDAIPPAAGLSPHGGIDYARTCARRLPEAIQVCHVRPRHSPSSRSAPVRDNHWHEDAWWFGFTANKPGDLVPGIGKPALAREEGETYRGAAYMFEETTRLARQLKALEERSVLDADDQLLPAAPRGGRPGGR